ncbi:MAG: PIG-L family deacetylase [Polaribacter sp.]|nr:PIG-L family deacetylase [Polaribacter sp.]
MSFGQKPAKLSSNQIYEKIQKLNFLGTALYIAAHPDDENTRLISYLANHLKARTGYLSLTRGDGGQNLIGPEIGELLGVIRTQELIAARNIDGGEQFFTRANDFGFSKHPDETFGIWEKEKVLSDVVWAIRTFKPDVIINRFNHETPGSTHGHHTTSAMLSVEAFDLVGDENQFSEQLKFTNVWQPKRLFFNTSSWFYRNSDDFQNATKELSKVDVGIFYPLKGLSNNELASMASSQHLCQGFGRLTTRGSENEYLEFLKGDTLADKNDIFSGIDTTWKRVEGGNEIGEILSKIEQDFDFVTPSNHLLKLLEAYQKVMSLKDDYWREIKQKQLLEIIEACTGLYLEVSAESSTASPDDKISVNFELINRSQIPVQLTSVKSTLDDKTIFKGLDLSHNQRFNFKEIILIKTSNFTSPYWLKNESTLGLYNVENQLLIGKPTTPREAKIEFNLVINYTPITITKNIIRRYAESDKGEIYEPFEILPKVTTKLIEKVLIFSDSIPKKVAVEIRAGSNFINGNVTLQVPQNWRIEPENHHFDILQKNDRQVVEFLVFPPKNQQEGTLKVLATINEKEFNKELIEINYNHIPKQSVLLNSEAKIVRLNIEKSGNNIGYIKGAGDLIPESLRQIGYQVEEIMPSEINEVKLQKYDAIILGIRAYNVIDNLKFKQKYLLDFVENGGNLIVQYNTDRGVDVAAPFMLKLSNDRVTDESSEVLFLDEAHPILNFPNKITQDDFKDWIQERGLYFPSSWGEEFTPIFSMHDKGESPKKGSLLIAKFGKGNYIYTGLSFFRELPSGVSGAYKLFANMLSLPKNVESTSEVKN